MLKMGNIWDDASALDSRQDETFDFIKDYDFSKFGKKDNEGPLSHTSQIKGREHLPAVQGKNYLMNMVVQSRKNLSESQKEGKMKRIPDVQKEDWLMCCQYFGYTQYDYDLEADERPWVSF